MHVSRVRHAHSNHAQSHSLLLINDNLPFQCSNVSLRVTSAILLQLMLSKKKKKKNTCRVRKNQKLLAISKNRNYYPYPPKPSKVLYKSPIGNN